MDAGYSAEKLPYWACSRYRSRFISFKNRNSNLTNFLRVLPLDFHNFLRLNSFYFRKKRFERIFKFPF